MKQKTYRRLVRLLFLLLFLFFFLLYLLLRGEAGGAGASGQQNVWQLRHLELSPVTISDERSGGFLIGDFPTLEATDPTAPDFNDNAAVCRVQFTNEAAVPVTVQLKVYGTNRQDDKILPPGLFCGLYHDDGSDPFAGRLEQFFDSGSATLLPYEERTLSLWHDEARFPSTVTLAAGETRYLTLFFWADEATVPLLTELNRAEYSVTVKLSSRAAIG